MSKDIVTPSGLEHFLNRTSAISGLAPTEIASLLQLPNTRASIKNGKPFADVGDPDCVYVVDQGIVLQRSVAVSKRPVVGFFVPGDLANLPYVVGEGARAAFYTSANGVLHVISRHRLLAATQQSPKLLRALSRDIAVEVRHTQTWLVNLGGRRAAPRLAHFLLDYSDRLDIAGHRAEQEVYPLPFTQTLLSAMLGLSLVHTNKSYRLMYQAGLIEIKNQHLTILDRDGLRRFAALEYISQMSRDKNQPQASAWLPPSRLQALAEAAG